MKKYIIIILIILSSLMSYYAQNNENVDFKRFNTVIDREEIKSYMIKQDSMYKAYLLVNNNKTLTSYSNVNWIDFMNYPEYNQDNCWAYATTGVMEGLLNKYLFETRPGTAKINLYEEFIGSGEGGPVEGFLKAQSGVPSKQGINTFPNYDNGYFRTSSYQVQTQIDIDFIKNALQTSCPYPKLHLS